MNSHTRIDNEITEIDACPISRFEVTVNSSAAVGTSASPSSADALIISSEKGSEKGFIEGIQAIGQTGLIGGGNVCWKCHCCRDIINHVSSSNCIQCDALRPPSAEVLQMVSEVDLFDIARSGRFQVLQALEQANALGLIPEVNKLHPIVPEGYSTEWNMTALMIACNLGHAGVVEILLRVPNLDVNIQENGWTALIWASRRGDTPIVQALLSRVEVDVNILTHDGWPALFYASSIGHTSTVLALLRDARVDVNWQDTDGYTALMWATYQEHVGTVQALLTDKRVDAMLKNKKECSALDKANETGQVSIIAMLRKPRTYG